MTDFPIIFEEFTKKRILIIGDVMIDAYLWGKVERISPEAPVPVVSVQRRENRLGGAANVALNVKSLGATPVLCSVIGDDENGALFCSLMDAAGMTGEGIVRDDGRKTTSKTRVISGTQHSLRIDDEQITPLSHDQEERLMREIARLVRPGNIDAIIFEDYDKGSITPGIIAGVVALARERAIPVTVDPKKRNFHDYRGVTLFKPNFKELCEGTKVDLKKGDLEGLHQTAAAFQVSMGIDHVLVTLSELGMMITSGDSYYHVPTHIRQIADVSGAGDTVISVATLCLACGLNPRQIAEIGNLAGGLVCEQVGVVPIDKNLLLQEIVNIKKQ